VPRVNRLTLGRARRHDCQSEGRLIGSRERFRDPIPRYGDWLRACNVLLVRLLDGKVAIITGGTSGVGAACAEKFVEEGARIVISARRTAEARALEEKLGGAALFVLTDVSDENEALELGASGIRVNRGFVGNPNAPARSTCAGTRRRLT
jgi:hypothetical protein